MAFLDKVGATISKTGSNISTKTKSMVDASNYGSQLKVCENKLKDAYAEIGEAYYMSANADDIDEEMAAKFTKIAEIQEAMGHLKAKLRVAKGLILCAKCGAELPAGTTFCSSCGTKVDADGKAEETSNAVTVKCPKCGTELKEDATFCSGCGAKL